MAPSPYFQSPHQPLPWFHALKGGFCLQRSGTPQGLRDGQGEALFVEDGSSNKVEPGDRGGGTHNCAREVPHSV